METQNPLNLGSSLIVPSVQELAKQTLTEVPSRYLRSDQDPPIIISYESENVTPLESVPVIDLQNLLSQQPTIGESELDSLHSACKQWGFFQVKKTNNYNNNNLLFKCNRETRFETLKIVFNLFAFNGPYKVLMELIRTFRRKRY